MRVSLPTLAFIPLLAGLNGPLGAEVLRVGVEDDSPPKWLPAVAGRPSGFCADLLELIVNSQPRLTFTYPSEALPQRRMEAGLQEGSLDLICGLTRTPEREGRFHYIEKPIYQMEYVLFTRAADTVAPQTWSDVRALGANGLILLNYDSSAIGRLQRIGGLSLDSSGRTAEQNFKKLVGGRGRFFYYIRAGGMAEIQRLELQGEVRISEPAMDKQPFYLLTGKHISFPLRQHLLEVLETLEQNGDLKRLQQHWNLR